jgi:hypothetical protein
MPQIMLPESTEANMIEQIQLEEDARLFGERTNPDFPILGDVGMQEDASHEAIEAIEQGTASATGERPRAGYSHTNDAPSSEQVTRKREASPDASVVPPKPPIYTWLADTEPPTDPDSVIRWREEVDARRTKRQRQNGQDLEVFRNVEIALPLKDDVPTCSMQDSARTLDTGPETGAYVLYRNILDQYPKLHDPIAWRFAKGNWKRIRDSQEIERAGPPPTPNLTEFDDQPMNNLLGDSGSSNDGREGDYVLKHSPFHLLHLRDRKISSLPPPPRLVLKRHTTTYSAECHLCHQTIELRDRRDWR